jgi:hypothetical protein
MLTRPFSLFRVAEGVPEVRIEVPGSPPPYDSFPRLHASYSTPRNVVYDARGCRIVDYFGKGATVEDKTDSAYTIYGEDTNFLQEVFYLLVLSLFGRYCDRNGMLRIHAMAASYRDTAVVIPMTMGGGNRPWLWRCCRKRGSDSFRTTSRFSRGMALSCRSR